MTDTPGDQAETPVRAGAWQDDLRAYLGSLAAEELEDLHARSINALDRATRAMTLTVGELARLSAIADYLASRIERRQQEQPLASSEVLLMGLMAGYQLAAGEHAGAEPDPFAD